MSHQHKYILAYTEVQEPGIEVWRRVEFKGSLHSAVIHAAKVSVRKDVTELNLSDAETGELMYQGWGSGYYSPEVSKLTKLWVTAFILP